MSSTARTNEIDELVSSVRNFVAHNEPGRHKPRVKSELLVLTPALRVSEADALGTPVEYAPMTVPAESNVLRLDASQQPQRASLEATIAELEAAVTSQPEDWEPDEGETFEQAAWAASAFHAPLDDSPEPAETAAETSDMSAQIAQEVEAALGIRTVARDAIAGMSEETLKAMVVQIIRDELAGELGEKITRSVRKLVRREINRVLASRDLD